ncbi:endonuclease III [candidate division WWE3 bacterium RIFOXYC1_FULL_39_7]|uniref:Endonuclease III n=2 Tax=Katanobacteria TaxID=422282 RepID=A0A1F4X5R1_UNCKA|nr:MAG: endonuclease III [candidate division WWE3 bacterium RIFOXYC1_FULL_39_7]OGC76891.1 MAG: endonuclease III [candidate division WWE3 bacterium RIFOXYD1_FULL_39_9]
MELNKHAEQVAQILAKTYPSPKTELIHKNEYELAVSVMLSAQTTDKKVNQITPNLFEKYKSWGDLADASLSDLQKDIHGVNFHLGKADRLIKAGKFVQSEFGGKLPQSLNELIKIPGIARKSANVILQELWDIAEGIVVDTHVTRVSNRLGLTNNSDAVRIEQDLMKIVPQKYWRNFSGAVVLHGRYICIARKPKCEECVLNKICPSAFKL